MDPITLLAGAGILATGFLLGRFLPARHHDPQAVKPICGCGHHHAHHDPATGVCAGTDRRDRYSDKSGAYLGVHDFPCTCRQYSGPQSVDTYYAPELTTDA